jgi:RNA polymerase sigma-70 factor (ECF subfamily)
MNNAATIETANRFIEQLRPIECELDAYCRRMVYNPADAPDALQNAVCNAARTYGRFQEGTNFRAWMFTILTREIFAINRQHARIAAHECGVEPEELEAYSDTAHTSDQGSDCANLDSMDWCDQSVATALQALTRHERSTLLLRAIGGFHYEEIASSLEIPLGSVIGYLGRARRKMRSALARPKNNFTKRS